MHIDFTTIIDYIGTFAFAISGIRLASAKRFDWFGAYVVEQPRLSGVEQPGIYYWVSPLSGCTNHPT